MFTMRMFTITVATLGLIAATAHAGGPSAPLKKGKAAIKVSKSVKKLPFGKNVKATLGWINTQMRGTKAQKAAQLKLLSDRLQLTSGHRSPVQEVSQGLLAPPARSVLVPLHPQRMCPPGRQR